MTVVLLSKDDKVYHLCVAILAEKSPDSRPLLLLAEPRGPLPKADLYIWDYRPELDFARCMAARDPSRHILLVERRFLEAPDGSHLRGLKLVLKPVTKAALATWLVPALEDLADGGTPPAGGPDEIISSLVEANIRMQEYELDRSSFLAKVTHDFRAPLTAMSGYCGLLLAGAFGPLTQSQREVLNRTLNSLKRLTSMSSAMLQFTSNSSAGRAVKPGRGQSPRVHPAGGPRDPAPDRRETDSSDIESKAAFQDSVLRCRTTGASFYELVRERVQVHPQGRAHRGPGLSVFLGTPFGSRQGLGGCRAPRPSGRSTQRVPGGCF